MAVTDSIQAGQLRHRINIYSQSAMDGTGKPIIGAAGAQVGWTLLFENVPAQVVPVKVGEMIRGGQDISQVIIMVTLRFMVGVLGNMRVRWQGGNYIIQGIENVEERNHKLVLTCIALGNQT